MYWIMADLFLRHVLVDFHIPVQYMVHSHSPCAVISITYKVGHEDSDAGHDVNMNRY